MELLLSSALYLETWGSESVENRLRFAQLMTELPRQACSVTLLRPVLFSVFPASLSNLLRLETLEHQKNDAAVYLRVVVFTSFDWEIMRKEVLNVKNWLLMQSTYAWKLGVYIYRARLILVALILTMPLIPGLLGRTPQSSVVLGLLWAPPECCLAISWVC